MEITLSAAARFGKDCCAGRGGDDCNGFVVQASRNTPGKSVPPNHQASLTEVFA
jgi:hypothetical protein